MARLRPRRGGDGPTEPVHPMLQLLVREGRLAADAAATLEAEARREGVTVVHRLVRRGFLDDEEFVRLVIERYGLARAGPAELADPAPVGGQLQPAFLRRHGLLPLAGGDGRPRLAMVDPFDFEALHAVEVALGAAVEPAVVTLADFERAFTARYEGGREVLDRIAAEAGRELVEEGEGAGVPDAESAPVVRLVRRILADAVRLEASDVHFEPADDRLVVRYRIHGRLREVTAPPARLAAAVISRLKIVAGLDVAERRLPQDGRARLELDGREVDLRVATVPTIRGESAVVRILDHGRRRIALDGLGLPEELARRLHPHIRAPHGMVLVTGPTGSGKTTTLYAALAERDATREKIVSIEDPVEYRLEGITQIQVRPEVGLDFARVLRSVLRHDPDVLLVGETRDVETARIAVHAALTGHLVFTTLHTDTAAGAVARLLDMGVEPYLLASVLRAVVGQRLVGRLCPDCRRPRAPDPLERALFRDHGITAPAVVYEPGECPRCAGIGYVGRIGLFELLELDDGLREAVRARAPSRELQRMAVARGMGTMRRDGLSKVAAGTVALADVLRLTEG